MPYKYIGRTTNFNGKTLWEIVGNLKNFGIGRVVARSAFERYPEPSYLKILKVDTLPCPETQNVDNLRKVRVVVERTFRGKTFPKPVTIESTSYKADYKLIPKDEESEYCNIKKNEPLNQSRLLKIYPKFTDFPPLLKELIERDMKAAGVDVDKEPPRLEVVYQKKNSHNYRLAEGEEKPNVDFRDHVKNSPFYKELYANVDSYKKIISSPT